MTRAPEKMVTRPGRARTVLLALLALALGTALTACFGVPEDSPAPGEDEVLNLVALACPNEGWEVVRVEETREEPQQLTYTLRSTERALTFTAVSEITEPSYSLFYNPPKPRITCDYPEVVREIYAEEARDLLAERAGAVREGELYAPERTLQLYVCDYGQLEEAVALLAEADRLFEAELAYNDQQWIRECAASDVSVRWYNGAFEEDGRPDRWQPLGDVELYGELDTGAALEELAGAYAQLVADGTAPADPTLPGRFLEGLHRSCIDRITVRGEEVPFGFDAESIEDFTNPYQVFHWREDEGVVARWSEGEGRYLVRVNLNGTSGELHAGAEEAGSWLVQQVARLAGGTYEEGDGHFEWHVGDVSGRMAYVDGESGQRRAEVVLNGEARTVSCSSEDVNGTTAVAMPVDEFAALFGLEAHVDEKNGAIELY